MPDEYPGSERHFTPPEQKARGRTDYPINGFGNRVSDVNFLLSCLEYMMDATGERMDPEDMAVITAIKLEQQ